MSTYLGQERCNDVLHDEDDCFGKGRREKTGSQTVDVVRQRRINEASSCSRYEH